MADRQLGDVGGTPGGLGSFLMGLVMSCVGGYLLTSHVLVTSSYWNFTGSNFAGISLIPFFFGGAMLFGNGRSVPGWILTIAGVLFIFAGIIMNLHIYFQPASLFNTLI